MKKLFQKRPGYEWVIVFACCLMIFTSLGFCSSNKSLYMKAITEANNIPRWLYAYNDSLRFVSTAIVNVFFGFFVSKFGTKKLILFGMLCLMGATFLYSIAENVILFFVGGCLIGIGFSFASTAMVGCVVSRWFQNNRGTIMGIILSANGLGGALAAQIVTPMIHEAGNPFGYRNAYRLVIVVLLVVTVLLAILLRDKPKNDSQGETVVAKKKARSDSWVGIDFKNAKRMPFFWTTATSIFFTGFMLQGINGISATHMEDVEIDPAFVATVLSIHSLILTVSKFLTGFSRDRFGLRFTATMCCLAGTISMFALAMVNDQTEGHICAMVYGLLSAFALPLETIMLPLFASDLFGEKSFSKILGFFVSVNTVGYALGSPVMNLVYEWFGSYFWVFIVCGILMCAVAVLMQFNISRAAACRKAIEEKNA